MINKNKNEANTMFFFNRDEMSETGNCYQISLCYIGPWLEMKVHISKNDIFLANRPLNKDHVENKTKLKSFMTKKSDFIISFGSMINREQFYRYHVQCNRQWIVIYKCPIRQVWHEKYTYIMCVLLVCYWLKNKLLGYM